MDYTETFSPVARFASIRAILAISVAENLVLKQFDIKTAFLNDQLEEAIYMSQPEDYDDCNGRVCKLNKSLYGLKQASRCWHLKFTKLLQQFNFRPCAADLRFFPSVR